MTVKSWKGWFLCQLDQHRSLILAEDGGCGSWLSPGWLHWHTQSCNCASPRVSAGTVLCPALDMGYSTAPPCHRQRNQLIFSASTGPQPPHFESDHLLMAGAFGTWSNRESIMLHNLCNPGTISRLCPQRTHRVYK